MTGGPPHQKKKMAFAIGAGGATRERREGFTALDGERHHYERAVGKLWRGGSQTLSEQLAGTSCCSARNPGKPELLGTPTAKNPSSS